MAWVFLSVFVLLSSSLEAQDTLLLQQSKQQVRQYVQAVHRDQQVPLNLWALVEVSRNKQKVQAYINHFAAEKGYRDTVLQTFGDTTIGYTDQLLQFAFIAKSPFLFVAYLLAEPRDKITLSAVQQFADKIGYADSDSVNYQAIVNAILHHKPVTAAMLPVNHFHPLQFALFFVKHPIQNKIITSDYLKKTTKAWENNGLHNYKGLMRSLYRAALFRTYYLLDRYGPIESLYDLLVHDRIFPNSIQKLTMLLSLHYSMYRLGYYDRSLHIIQDYSLPLAQYLDQKETAIKLKIAEGLFLYYVGKIKQSEQTYLDIKNSAVFKEGLISRGRVLNNLAIDYFKEGRFNRYLNLEFKALAESKKEGNYKSQLDILKNLFLVYRARKNFDAAKQYLTQAQQLAEQKQNKANIAQLHYYEGLLYRDAKNNMDQALTSFNKALQLISYSSDYKIYRDILTKKALLLEKQEKYRSAKAIYQRVLKHAKERNDRSYALYTLFNKANTYLSLEQLDSAQVMLDSLFIQNLSVLSFYQLVKARTVQAHFQAQTGEPERGITIIQPVINQIVKRSRNSGSLETGFWQVEPEYLNAFQQYADMLIQTGQNREAVEVLDRFKTINSVAIYRNPLLRARVLNNKQLSEYKRLTNKLDGLRKKLIATPKKKRRAIQQQINKLSARKNAMDQKVTSRANLHAVSVRRIQQKMNAHQRVLDFTDLNNIYYEAVIARNSIHFKKIKLTPRRRALFTKSIKQIAHGNPDLTNLYAITRLLGINKLPAQVHKLTIMPDSYLYQLPLDVLPLTPPADSQNYGGVHYSIERFQTNYMTSLNDFNTTRDTVHYTYGYVGYGISQFGDGRPALSPLPRAKAEIEQSARELSALPQKKLFFNDSATWQAFKKAAPHARILHLATHSLVSGRNPLFSRIYLTPTDSSKEDERSGRVFAYQLFNLHLSNQLIMLNSCESGKGSYLQGTGVVGISRALRYAGANALVLNLWSVNDMLAEQFAVKFYEGINEGLAKSVALRRAKLYFLNKRNANPHYWGPYMLLGDNQPLITPHKKMNKMAAIAFITFFFVLAVASSIIAIRRKHN